MERLKSLCTIDRNVKLYSCHGKQYGDSSETKNKITMKVKSFSCVQLFVTPYVAYQVPPSMGFSMQEYWSGLPFSSPGDLPDPGIEPRPPALQADSLPYEPSGNKRGIKANNWTPLEID